MSVYFGDFPSSHTSVCIPFDSFAASTGAPTAVTNFASSDIKVYKDGSNVERTSANGITVTASFDSLVGLQMIVIDLSDNSDAGFYAAGHEYAVAVSDITVDGQTLRFWAGTFSIERAGGALAVLKARLPASLVSGRIDASVGAMASGVLTATAIAVDAITDAKVASDVTIASVTGAVGSVTGAVGSVTAGVTVTTNNDKAGYGLSSAAVQAVWDALTSALTTSGSIGKWILDKLDVVLSTRASQTSVDDVPTNAELATSQAAADDATLVAIGALNNLSAAQVNAEVDTAIADAALATAANLATVDTVVDGIKAVTDALPNAGALTSLATAANVATAAGYIDTEVAAIKAVTDKIDDTLEDDAGTYRFTTNALEQAPTGGSAPTAAAIADAVWEEALADHEGTAGSTAEALASAGGSGASAADIADAVLDEALAGHVSAGTLGKAVADTLAAVDTEVAAIKAKTDQLVFTTANKVDARAFTVDDKTGFALTSAYDPAKTAATQTSVDDLPTNAELATSQASADDATLAAIAGLSVPTVSAIAAGILAAAALAPIDANVKEINDTAVNGDGGATPWGP